MKSYKGTTAECVKHLAHHIEGPDIAKNRKILADFVGVQDQSVYLWMRDDRLPMGETLIRLRFYLEFLGYDVSELRDLENEVRTAGRIFAFNIVSMAEIAELVGYQGQGRNPVDTVISILRGVQGVSGKRLEEFKSLVELYGSQLPARTQQVKKIAVFGAPAAEQSEPRSRKEPLPGPKHALKDDAHHALVVEAVSGSIVALLPLVEAVLTDDFTPADRANVRQLVGEGGVSRLSRLMTQLSSEDARSFLSKQQ